MFNFGEHLKELRKAQNITQKQLAQKINVSERGIQNYELNARKPTYDTLIALADHFDVSIDYLVGQTDTPTLESVSPVMPVQESTSAITLPDPDLQQLVNIYNHLSSRRQATLLERGKILMEDQTEEEIHSTKKKA